MDRFVEPPGGGFGPRPARGWGPDVFTTTIDLSPDGDGLIRTRTALREWLAQAGVRGAQLDEVLVAVGEACANVFDHSGAAERAGGQPAAWLEATLAGSLLCLTVNDRGVWKEPTTDPAVPSRRGRGRLLMTNLVDRMEIRTGPNGTTVELIKQLR